MLSSHEPYVRQCLDHIRALAHDIGPRGSTTEAERRGAVYCENILEALGLAPRVETFISAKSIYLPQVFTGILMVAAFAVYPLFAPISAWIAVALIIVAFVCQNLELAFRDNPYRWLIPKAPSQNVIATLPPHGEHRQDLVLIGHIDTNRTPLIFSSDNWVDAFRIFATITFIGGVAQVALSIIGAVSGLNWVWPLTAIPAVLGLGLAATGIQADLSPFTAGANDNATAVGTVLALARYLQDHPLEHTRVWFACTGCEEVKHYGAADFFRRHRAELLNPKALVFEMLGRDGPAYLLQEGMQPASFQAHPEMIAVAARIAAENPEWGAHPTRVDIGYTEMADALRAGVPAITLIGIGAAGLPIGYRGKQLYWHRRDDTVDKIDPEVLSRAWAYACAIIRAVDSSSDSSGR